MHLISYSSFYEHLMSAQLNLDNDQDSRNWNKNLHELRGTRVNILYIKLYLSTYIYFKFTMHYTHWQQQNLCSLNDIPFKLSNGECCGIGFKLRNFYRGIQNNKIYILLAFLINKIQYILFYDVYSLNTVVTIKALKLVLIHWSRLITKSD